MLSGEQARLVLTDEPYNVPNVGHVTSEADHREFAMAAGEMNREEFAAFNRAWMSSAALYVIDGGLIATFIDWRSVELVLACGRDLGLDLLNVVVWSKSNAAREASGARSTSSCPCLKRAPRLPSTTSNLGASGAGGRMCGAIPGLRRSALTRARASQSIRPSNRGRCWKTPCSTSAPATKSFSSPSPARARHSSPPRRRPHLPGDRDRRPLLRRHHPPLAGDDRRRGRPRGDRRDIRDRQGPAPA